jgi:hypothetical protein
VYEVDEPADEITITPLDRGSALHVALDRFNQAILAGELPQPGPSGWTDQHVDALADIFDRVGADTERAGRTGRPAYWAGQPVVAVFEPRSNTSRRAVFQREYAEAFDAAARVIVQIVPDAPIYSAFGGEPERLSAERLAADVTARGVPAVALPGVDAIVDELAKTTRPGDVVVTLSNGGFGGIWDKLLARLSGD